ncbi:vitamin B12 dependent-methionine synthase activation domain-containing protein [[Clostridium] dakarense]|uniref:vitamin B12 dependent-methionine synthase activation domain-containing protein n=1 Tax=Faecalimicrobium dakarense TaxID=1301100 RepID=UPI0004B61237|nr:vitamin B12 dependent-methionine synthase activation domain-containing protein [[Clostridium] dakarense]
MGNDFFNLININENEVLRYLEYKGQDINDNLKNTISECIKLAKEKINPRYMLRVYPILRKKENNEIEIKGSNIKFSSKDLYKLLENCDECIIIATTVGMEIEKEIRKYSYAELTKSIILDACATTAIEEFCDLLQDDLKLKLSNQGKYITNRYSPGYGDLSIDTNIEIINFLNSPKEIGLTITENKIMIPRKSVIAIIGISNSKVEVENKSCLNCKNYDSCKYKRGDEACGNKRLHKR